LLSEFRDAKKNWNFEGVTSDPDIHACMLWEYARQSNFMRKLESYWEEPCIQQLSIQERQRLFLFRASSVFPFPDTPWRELQTEAKERIIKSANRDTCASKLTMGGMIHRFLAVRPGPSHN
jgi:hypothetical protein